LGRGLVFTVRPSIATSCPTCCGSS